MCFRMDSETETTLLGLVHYNATRVGKPQLESRTEDQSSSVGALEPGELVDPSLTPPKFSAEPTPQNFEVVSLDELVESDGLDPKESYKLSQKLYMSKSRYFSDPDRRSMCFRCYKRGHRGENCLEGFKYCTQCGLLRHRLIMCPLNECTTCKEIGHLASRCKNKAPTVCKLCCNVGHCPTACPSLWRHYILSDEYVEPPAFVPSWCYSCGERGHFGDFCKFRRTNLVTAFNVQCGDHPTPVEDDVAYHQHAFFKPIYPKGPSKKAAKKVASRSTPSTEPSDQASSQPTTGSNSAKIVERSRLFSPYARPQKPQAELSGNQRKPSSTQPHEPSKGSKPPSKLNRSPLPQSQHSSQFNFKLDQKHGNGNQN